MCQTLRTFLFDHLTKMLVGRNCFLLVFVLFFTLSLIHVITCLKNDIDCLVWLANLNVFAWSFLHSTLPNHLCNWNKQLATQ